MMADVFSPNRGRGQPPPTRARWSIALLGALALSCAGCGDGPLEIIGGTWAIDADNQTTTLYLRLEYAAAGTFAFSHRVSSENGFPHCTEAAMRALLDGKPPVDAVVDGVTLVEDDPEDHSVGLGGLPNEEGVVQLDASVMGGKTGLSGAVAAIERIKNPAAVALKVMRYTDHCLLVGEGARRFARAHGFPEQELLTEEARKIWLYWKATLSDRDDWLPTDPAELPPNAKAMFGITGTINCCAVDRQGDLAGVTTTSGLAFKIPGRVGDSPLVGAGLFVVLLILVFVMGLSSYGHHLPGFLRAYGDADLFRRFLVPCQERRIMLQRGHDQRGHSCQADGARGAQHRGGDF